MQKFVWRTYRTHWRRKQTYLSRATSQTKAWSTVWRPRRIRLRTWTSYRMAILSFFHDAFIFVITMATKQRLVVGQFGAGIRGNVHPGLNSEFFFDCSSDVLSLAGNIITWQSTVGVNSTLTAHTFFSCTVVVQSSCHWLHAQISRITRGSRITEHIVSVFPQNIHTSWRNVLRHASLDDTMHGHSFFTCPEPNATLLLPVPGKPNFSSRDKKRMHWPMFWGPMSNEVQHAKNTGNLIRPMGQILTHHADPSPNDVKCRFHTNWAIQQVEDNWCACKGHLTRPDRPHKSSTKSTGSRNIRRLYSM